MDFVEYNKCVDLYADHIYRFVLKNIQNEEMARDVVQETFVKIWTKVKTVEFKRAKSYIFTTAYHTMIDAIRVEKRYSDIAECAYDIGSDGNVNVDLKEILNRAIDTLPINQKSAILLRDYEGYAYKEIADIMDISIEQVKINIFRGRNALREIIGSIDNLI